MARREYKQRAEYKQIWPIYIGILTETSQNPQKQAPRICLKSACIPSFSLLSSRTIGPSETKGNLPKQPKIAKNSFHGSSWVLLAPWLLLASKRKGNSHIDPITRSPRQCTLSLDTGSSISHIQVEVFNIRVPAKKADPLSVLGPPRSQGGQKNL